MRAAMKPDDAVITAYRAHGWTYIMGVPPLGVLAELTGNVSRRIFCIRRNLTTCQSLKD